jgi:hypothetical protein
MGDISQKLLKEILIPIDHLQPDFSGVLSQRLKSFLVFLVGMDVGIEEISDNFFPFFSDSFKGIDSAIGTTDMEEDFHFLESVSSNVKIQISNESQNPKLNSWY